MLNSSEARRSFAVEPLREKSVTELAGVTEVLGKQLKLLGFDKVISISCLHRFLLRNESPPIDVNILIHFEVTCVARVFFICYIS